VAKRTWQQKPQIGTSIHYVENAGKQYALMSGRHTIRDYYNRHAAIMSAKEREIPCYVYDTLERKIIWERE